MPSRLLVVAPHPDDETLGCGGLIAKVAQRGGVTHTLFVTDGGASHPPSTLWPRHRLVAARAAEAVEALRRLGAASHPRTFLGLRDAEMPEEGSPRWAEAAAQSSRTIATFKPDLVLLPWRRDPHCDHRSAFHLVTEALRMAGAGETRQLEYAIWLDELGVLEDHPDTGEVELVAVDVSSLVTVKRWALEAHATQLGKIAAAAPGGFQLTPSTVERLMTPTERYFLACG